MSHMIEDLYLLDIWVEPTDDCCITKEYEFDEKLPAADRLLHTQKSNVHAASSVAESKQIHTVSQTSVQYIAQFLSAARYARRWPRMPLNDLYATSVEHPFCKDADGTPFRILLDTKVLQRSEAGAGGLTRHGTYEANDDGVYPPH